jgi:glycosyltransferase involved in cell wall biosynthesis
MKIIIIGPNVGMGGVERASSNIANGLKIAGHNITYLALIPEPLFFKLDTNYIEPDGFNERKMDFIQTIKYIRRNVKDIQPDHIIAFTKFYAALANLALLFSKFKLIVTERSSPLYQWPKQIEIFCKTSFLLKTPAGVISQTSIASEYHKKYYGKTKYTVIPNAVRNITEFPELERENIILAVGRFNDPCKGFDLLIGAFNLLKNENWRLVFAGGTKEEGEYLLNEAILEVTSRIEFLGAVTNMDELYARAGIFVMPSRSEGFPNALAEAVSAGCPAISFDFIAGPRDIIQENVTGLIVENGNIRSLSETIDKLILDSDLRTAFEQNAKKNKNSLNRETIIKSHIDFLNK